MAHGQSSSSDGHRKYNAYRESQVDVMEPKSFRLSRLLLGIGTALVFFFGLVAVLAPRTFTAADFRTTTGQEWDDFVRAEPSAARYIRGECLELGSAFLALGTSVAMILAFAYKPGARWAWWAILLVSALAGGGDTVSLIHQQNLLALGQIGLVLLFMCGGLAAGRKSLFRPPIAGSA
jgi:hypothetical protein